MTEMQRFLEEKTLTREMLLALVDRIEATGDRALHIRFRYRDEYARLLTPARESEEMAQ